jgi:hypothetical protein
VDAIGFSLADKPAEETMDLVFMAQINEWKGNAALQLRLKDFRPSYQEERPAMMAHVEGGSSAATGAVRQG